MTWHGSVGKDGVTLLTSTVWRCGGGGDVDSGSVVELYLIGGGVFNGRGITL